jgi:hypothetical protein
MSMVSYLASGFVYAKVANLILFFRADPRMGLVYLLFFVIQVKIPGTDVMIKKNFVGKNCVLDSKQSYIRQNFDHNLGF